MKFIFSISLFFSLTLCSNAQQIGAKVGVVINLGSHVNGFGINSSVFYSDYFYQINFGLQNKFNILSYGNRKLFTENRIAFGGLILGGKKNNSVDFDFHSLNHNTNYQYALGFNYLWYFDEVGTSQKSGSWSIHANQFSLLFENDVFGGQARDRFRSGILQISFRTNEIKYFTNLYIWTGETKNSSWIKEKTHIHPNGYRILEHLPYGKTSHGILNLGVLLNGSDLTFQKRFLKSENYSIKLGIDSEQIRHFFQNKISHDLILLPGKINRNTPHYPRLDEEGKPVFEKQKIRKNKVFFQFSTNENWSN
jgi:hypothetical protein